MRFPDRETPIGKMIDSYLKNNSNLSDQAIHLLFSANRWEHNELIRKSLSSGKNIVMDRYSFSGVAFSSAKGLDMDWCLAPERGLAAPDIVLYLELPSEEAEKRGGYGEERYEKKEMQIKVGQAFKTLQMNTEQNWKVINANKSIDELHQEILDIASKTIEKVKETSLVPL